jgi:hypothetical protein
MPIEEKFTWLMKLKKQFIPSQKSDEVGEAFSKMRDMATQLEVEISRCCPMNGAREVPVMWWDGLSGAYRIAYPAEADREVIVGLVTMAVLLIIFSHSNNRFSYESINGYDNMGDYFTEKICDETSKIVQVLQKWGITY